MFKLLKEKIYKLGIKSQRKLILKNATGGNYIGTYKFLDDKIICYVDSNLLKEHTVKNRKYELNLNGFYKNDDDSKKICENCNLLKPIYYIIKNVDFDLPLNIFSCGNAHILFEECTFTYDIKILHANDIIFENNQYEYINPMYCKEYVLRSVGPVNNLKFSNDNFINRHLIHPIKFGMKIKADNIEIINTSIYGDILSGIELECDNLMIVDSNINCNEIVMSSKKIYFYDSSTNANKGFIMDEDTIYIDFDQKNRKEKELENSRINLINVLRNLRDKCNQDIENKLENKENKLKNRKIKRYFK